MNLDCAELAKELGTTATVVARWEDGAELDCEDQYCVAVLAELHGITREDLLAWSE